MLNKIIFYNQYNAGDLFTARKFILELMSSNIAKEYSFSHLQDTYLTDDFISFTIFNDFCRSRESIIRSGDDLYFNTWIGYAYSKYVLPGIVCRLDKFRELYNDGLEKAGIDYRLTKDYDEYIPHSTDFKVDKTNVDLFIENRNKDRKSILISNGLVFSNQAVNFDMNYVVYKLCLQHADIDFIATSRFDFKSDNLFYTEDIIKSNHSDLKEIGYLSLFVDCIVGRSSGPYVYCQLKDNYNNPNKTFLSFTREKDGAHMAMGTTQAKLLWSNETNVSDVQRRIETIL